MLKIVIKKHLPNTITLLRLACSPMLFFLEPFCNRFLLLYLLLGISDLTDGFLARRWNVSSRFGARLDSAADFLLCVIMLYILFSRLCWPFWALVWVAIIFLLRFASLAINYVRFSQIAFLHSYANKVTGFLLLLFPLLIRMVGQNLTTIILCVIASISAVEEFLISVTATKFDPNCKSIFHLKTSD